MGSFDGVEFTGTTVQLDGNEFRGCAFRDCDLEFAASAPVVLENFRIDGCRWRFVGAAAHTIEFLAALGAPGGGGQAVVEQVLEHIRGGRGADPSSPPAFSLS